MHGRIDKRHLVEADVLLHAGDFTNTGEVEQVKSFSEWLRDYPATHKVVIAGNHDVTFDEAHYSKSWKRYHASMGKPYSCAEARAALTNCIYLEDEAVQVAGYTIYGSPWQPEFCDWAFNLSPGSACKKAWEAIPPCPDVLITHGPPHGFGDLCFHGQRAGCSELLYAIRRRLVPVSVAGHIHEGYGTVSDGVTLFVNASTCTLKYQPTNPPIIFDLPPPAELRRATAAAAAAEGRRLMAAAGGAALSGGAAPASGAAPPRPAAP